MKVAIVGAGALGLFYGARLQQAGVAVHFLARRDYQVLATSGLTVNSVDGDFRLETVNVYHDSEMIGPVDLVLVALKSFDNGALSSLITPLLAPNTLVLTLQNGLGNESALAERFGAQRCLGGVAFLCSNRGAPGVVHHLGAGRVTLGWYQGDRHGGAADDIAEMFRAAGIQAHVTTDLLRTRWEKLVWNIPFNGLSAVTGQAVDRLLATSSLQRLVRTIMTEVVAAANAQALSSPIAESYVDAMIDFTLGMGPYRPSMLIDREEGRPLEQRAIVSLPLQAGTDAGVAMPCTAMLDALLSLCSVETASVV